MSKPKVKPEPPLNDEVRTKPGDDLRVAKVIAFQVVAKFTSDPENASVFIDGGFVGQTPTSFFLPPKDVVDVRVQHPGYLPMEEELHRAKVAEGVGEGVGWESSYYYPLKPKR